MLQLLIHQTPQHLKLFRWSLLNTIELTIDCGYVIISDDLMKDICHRSYSKFPVSALLIIIISIPMCLELSGDKYNMSHVYYFY